MSNYRNVIVRRQAVATRFLGEIEMTDDVRLGCITMCQEFHTTTQKLSARFMSELERHNYVTPTSYLEMINTFKSLLGNKRKEVLKVSTKYQTDSEARSMELKKAVRLCPLPRPLDLIDSRLL